MKKILSLVLAVLLMTFVLSGCGSGSKPNNSSDASQAKKPAKVTIGTQSLADPESIVKAKSWFEEALGTKVDIVNFDAGRDVNTAMASGSIDFGLLGSVPASLAIANGVNCKVIYIQSQLGEIESLVVRKSLGIRDAQGLAGKKIATTFSSTSHYSLLKYLEANKVKASDVDIIDMKASDIVAAFKRGDIDGAFTWEPQVTTIINSGGVTLTSAREVAKLGYPTLDVEIVSTKFADQYPDTVKAYVACMDRAVKLYRDDPKAAGDAMAKDLGLTSEECLQQVKSSTWLTTQEQLGPDYFGSDAFANKMLETAKFLYQQGDITTEPSAEVFNKAVTGQYLK